MPLNRRIVLASRPEGLPTEQNFGMEQTSIPVAGPGQMLLKTRWLSLDPYMRARMSAAKSYTPPIEVGGLMVGGTIAEVVESNVPGFQAGDLVLSNSGWQEYAVAGPKSVHKLDTDGLPVTTALGVLGMPGLTAYVGLYDIGQPKPGETVVVSAAAGAVGSVVGQLAKLKGARAVGIAGGPEKCAFVVDELGFDACVDYKAGNFKEALAAACPNGVDVYFDNVGGRVADAVFDLLNTFARVPLCGRIGNLNDTAPPAGPDRVPALLSAILTRRLHVQGFIVSDHWHRNDAFLEEVGTLVKDGHLRYREDVTEGLENAVSAFLGLLQGKNLGKALVKL
ncbi:NADP-dependent oxidoreductase [Nitrospirillum sp. BR 11163]|uniref:NADP-dependent oxidoreductase n=1 Tax=Nitrospirillum sp. BR 11163 TaxID=3104323 RepID=UPI002B002ECD|nr:NADP-dependent oxidoreductase [Nitrospirillum sp. BR 11163]MEA1675592.1 NADP-dependent oxidoreductase [Nitrospirillum sp. BR 11163]